jgi:hypothetical protein
VGAARQRIGATRTPFGGLPAQWSNRCALNVSLNFSVIFNLNMNFKLIFNLDTTN